MASGRQEAVRSGRGCGVVLVEMAQVRVEVKKESEFLLDSSSLRRELICFYAFNLLFYFCVFASES